MTRRDDDERPVTARWVVGLIVAIVVLSVLLTLVAASPH